MVYLQPKVGRPDGTGISFAAAAVRWQSCAREVSYSFNILGEFVHTRAENTGITVESKEL